MRRLGMMAWLGAVCFTACDGGIDRDQVDALFALDARRQPLPTASADEIARGEVLFAAQCARCHDLPLHGQNGQNSHGLPTAGSPGSALGPRNVPTVFDTARQVAFGWDGTVPDLATMAERELVQRCGHAADAEVPAAARAIAGYVATLRSVGRWDRYVEGDDRALSAAERHGLAVFVATGCVACHGNRTLGGASVHKLGAAVPWPNADRGRAAVTGVAADEFVWKAPMLRRVAHTAPYLHDGSVGTLPEMVRRMAKHELGKDLADRDVEAIATFLRAVGDVDAIPR